MVRKLQSRDVDLGPNRSRVQGPLDHEAEPVTGSQSQGGGRTRRMSMKRSTLLAVCVAVAPFWSGLATACLVNNGSSEGGTPAGCSSAGTPCNLPPQGWSTSGSGIGIDDAFPNIGIHDAVFTGSSADPSPGILSQTLGTVAGQSYVLKFALLDESGFFLDTLNVALGGFQATIAGPAPGPLGYVSVSLTVPGADIFGKDVLSFQGETDPSNTAGLPWNLDDVTVDAVGIPEPPTAIMMMVALTSW